MELKKGFVNENSNTKLFCVGDDWQSIYQFTGSDVSFFLEFHEHFSHPEVSYLERNYRSTENIVNMSNSLISHNKKQISKTAFSQGETGAKPILFRISDQISEYSKIPLEYVYQLIKRLLSEGVKAEEIMVISRFNKRLKELEIKCGANKMDIKEFGAPRSKGIRFYSAHKSKGSQSKYVILLDIISGLYGFPCEIQDSSVLDLARRFKTKSHIEEERRLFYVALTRSEEFLYVLTVENNESLFIDEIESSLISIYITSRTQWDLIIDNYIPVHLKNDYNTIKRPFFCQRCGRILVERSGKYGDFLSCSGYPNCDFTYNFIELNDIVCPICGKKLVPRTGKYGKFLGCIVYPNCKFTYNIEVKSKKKLYCPKCEKRLQLVDLKDKKQLICSNSSKCDFRFEIY
ncbi:MAG: hypothetical protein GF311_06440 [Candidatus Lokiarchaeota archaeon]|nr:hypothetical protein [Candidatus Lokiarchaeota archaeon]